MNLGLILSLLQDPIGPNHIAAAQIKFESKEGIVATADHATWNWGERRALFRGNIVVVQQQTEVKAQEMTIVFTENSSILKIDASEKVSINDGRRHATSEKVHWHISKGALVLTGNPSLQTEDGHFNGGKITIHRGLQEIRCEDGCRLEIKSKTP